VSLTAIPPRIALTRDPDVSIGPNELAAVAAALQLQVNRDFAPHWHVKVGSVAAFHDSTVIPAGYWPIVIKPSLDEPGALGFHTDSHHQPRSFVEFTESWPTTCSHELLEMLADPWGSRLVAADLPEGRGRALVEVCDPCEAYTYEVDGFAMSDFVLPAYYGPVTRWRWPRPNANEERDMRVAAMPPLTFQGTVAHPLTIAHGGYLSYVVDRVWRQLTWFDGPQPATRTLGEVATQGASLREWIDTITARDAQPHVGSARS
jgi:hypothetical protein